MEEKWISVEELCDYLGIVKETIYRWIKKKPSFPAHKVGKLWKFKRSEVDAWVRSGEA